MCFEGSLINAYELYRAMYISIKIKEFYWSRIPYNVSHAGNVYHDYQRENRIEHSQMYLPWELFHLLKISIIMFNWDYIIKITWESMVGLVRTLSVSTKAKWLVQRLGQAILISSFLLCAPIMNICSKQRTFSELCVKKNYL